MGIIFDAFAIMAGGFLGSRFKDKSLFTNYTISAIGIMLISIVGFFENIFSVSGFGLESTNFLLVVFSLILGNYIGEGIKIDERLSRVANYSKMEYNAFVDATLFFGIGGLQISGPILMAVNCYSSQLILKSIIDFPFALMFGMTYGKISSLASLPVAAMQVLIAFSAYMAKSFFTDAIIGQLCAMGYIVLFFSGFNLICDSKFKVKNVNMIPGIFLIIIFNIFAFLWREFV